MVCFKPQRGKFTRGLWPGKAPIFGVSNPNGVNLHRRAFET